MDDTAAINAKLDHAGNLFFSRNIAIIDELWSAGFKLIGSEEGEIAVTRDELEYLVTTLFAAPFRLRWVWDDRSVTVENDIAWIFAQGRIEFVFDDHTDQVPYRLVAIFRRAGDGWQWRLYSGSEPEPPRRPFV